MKVVRINSNQEEGALLRSLCCDCGGHYRYNIKKIYDEADNRYYDEVLATCRKCSSQVEFLVDISGFFSRGKWKTILGFCSLLLLLCVFMCFSEDSNLRTAGILLLLVMVFFIVILARTLISLENRPPASRLQQPAGEEGVMLSDKDRASLQRLEQLGIATSFAPADPGSAFIGGAAKAAIMFGLKKLEQKDYEEAASSFDAALGTLEKQDPQHWKQVIAAAHYLKGRVLDEKGMQQEAEAEYNKALRVAPDYQLAMEAISRTQKRS